MKKYKPNKSVVLLTLYMVMVWTAYVCVNVTDKMSYVVLLALLFACVSYIVSYVLLKKAEQWCLRAKNESSRKKNLAVFGISAAVCLLLMLVWFVAFCPGSFSPDSINQYKQVPDGTYNDWHPVWHTFVFFTLPVKLTGSISSIVLFQMFYFSLVMGYMVMVIAKYAGLKKAVFAFAYIVLNPYTGYIMLYPWKDVAFALAGILGLLMSFEIYFSKAEWSSKLWRVIGLGMILASATLFRHNAVLYTAPLIFALFFHMKKKQWIQLLVTFLLSLVVIKGPVYHFWDVEKPDQRVIETMGLPMTIIANVTKEVPGLLDEELQNFVYAIATQEMWTNNYSCGDFNSIKWDGIDTSIVEEKGHGYVLKMMLKCIKIAPKEAVQAFCALTDVVYGFEAGLEGNISAGIADNEFGIEYAGNEKLAAFLNAYAAFVDNSMFKYLRTLGVCMFAMLVVILGKLKWKSWESWKKTFLCLPIFAYNFGTMFFLTGPDSRFFYITFMICPLVIIFALLQREEINNG